MVAFDAFFDEVMAWPPPAVEGEGAQAPPPAAEGAVRDTRDAAREGTGSSVRLRRTVPARGAVYLLTDAEDRIVQLASTGNLRHALQQRLAEPPAESEESGATPAPKGSRRRARLGEVVGRIRWRAVDSSFEASVAYHRAARVLRPDAYRELVGFGPAWFVHVDPAARIPKLVVSRMLRAGPGETLGPFATHPDAAQFVQILEDAFDLCRYDHILEQAPNGQACAYFEMGKCPAPCDGTVPMARYREMMTSALAFARGDRQAVFEAMQARMTTAAAELAFERAAAVRQQIERARGIEREAFRLVRPVEAFNYLVVQRGGGRTRVRPFLVRAGGITAGEAVPLKRIEQVVPAWLADMHREPPAPDDDIELLSEQVWLVSHWLFKRDPPGLFIHAEQLGDADALAGRIRDRFGRPPSVSERARDEDEGEKAAGSEAGE